MTEFIIAKDIIFDAPSGKSKQKLLAGPQPS
jgi:hypothetical protein